MVRRIAGPAVDGALERVESAGQQMVDPLWAAGRSLGITRSEAHGRKPVLEGVRQREENRRLDGRIEVPRDDHGRSQLSGRPGEDLGLGPPLVGPGVGSPGPIAARMFQVATRMAGEVSLTRWLFD